MALEVLEPAHIEELFNDGVDLCDPFTVLALANLSVERLRNANTSGLSVEERRYFNQGVEALRNQADAAAVDAVRDLVAEGHEADAGYTTPAAWMRHHLQLPKVEARARVQIVRLLDAHPNWERQVRNGQVGIDHLRAAARTHSLTNVREAFDEQADQLLDDAMNVSFERFEELLANLRRLADADAAARAADRRRDGRQLTMRQQTDGSWRLTARFGDVEGSEINHVLAHFIDAEWRVDWNDAKEQLGPDAAIRLSDLARAEPQRRADALHNALLAASAHPGEGQGPLPVLNILIDRDTFETELTGGDHDPTRYRDMTCRTQHGDPLPIAEASAMALLSHIRRVVYDATSTVIDLGRKQRLFTGAAREAVMLMHTTCIWHGCEAPIRRCQADHNTEWGHQSGVTCPHNGAPLCGVHNRLKHRMRYRIVRNDDGSFSILHPDGTPLG